MSWERRERNAKGQIKGNERTTCPHCAWIGKRKNLAEHQERFHDIVQEPQQAQELEESVA